MFTVKDRGISVLGTEPHYPFYLTPNKKKRVLEDVDGKGLIHYKLYTLPCKI
jgi:hypothetical protein